MCMPDVQSKLALAATQKPSNSDFYTTELAEFVETFFEITLPIAVFNYIFLISVVALAVEISLKTAFDRHIR